MAKNTYGTGCFLLLHTGEAGGVDRVLRTTGARKIDGRRNYALEGSVFIGGAAVQWLRDGLGLIGAPGRRRAGGGAGHGGVYFVPALAGLGAPRWDPAARGVILGLTRGTTAAHIARAALEGIAYQVTDLLGAVAADAGRATHRRDPRGRRRRPQRPAAPVPGRRAGAAGHARRADRVRGTRGRAAGRPRHGVWPAPDEAAAVWRAERTFAPDPAVDRPALLPAGLGGGLRARHRAAATEGWARPPGAAAASAVAARGGAAARSPGPLRSSRLRHHQHRDVAVVQDLVAGRVATQGSRSAAPRRASPPDDVRDMEARHRDPRQRTGPARPTP